MSAVTILQGDCLEVLQMLPNGSFDAVIADPPYGTTQNAWDSIIPLEPLWAELWRVCRGPVIMTASQPFTSVLVCSQLKRFKYDWTWKKEKGTGHLNAKKMPMRDKEDILVFYDRQPTYNPQFEAGAPYKNKAGKDHLATSSMTRSYGAYTNYREDNDGKRYPKQVLEFNVVGRGGVHPTQKPVALFEYLIRTYTNEGDNILDFSAGSGTTGVAAINTGRRATLIELSPEYVALATARIAKAGGSDDLLPKPTAAVSDLFG